MVSLHIRQLLRCTEQNYTAATFKGNNSFFTRHCPWHHRRLLTKLAQYHTGRISALSLFVQTLLHPVCAVMTSRR